MRWLVAEVVVGCVLAALAALMLAAYFAYLNLNPGPLPPGGYLYFGDGTGFVLAAVFAVQGATLVAIGWFFGWVWRNHLRDRPRRP